MRTALALLAVFGIGLVFAAPTTDECPVHHVAMTPAKLAIIYGLPSQAEFKEMEVAKKRFPFGRSYVLGGCIVGKDKTVDGFLCPKCAKARAAWLKKHGD
jgi:hypothetical protein